MGAVLEYIPTDRIQIAYYADFGRLLDHTWNLKRSLSDRISNSAIDEFYKKAKENGALGGKLLGAGNGGFLLLFVPVEKQESFKRSVERVKYVPF